MHVTTCSYKCIRHNVAMTVLFLSTGDQCRAVSTKLWTVFQWWVG